MVNSKHRLYEIFSQLVLLHKEDCSESAITDTINLLGVDANELLSAFPRTVSTKNAVPLIDGNNDSGLLSQFL